MDKEQKRLVRCMAIIVLAPFVLIAIAPYLGGTLPGSELTLAYTFEVRQALGVLLSEEREANQTFRLFSYEEGFGPTYRQAARDRAFGKHPKPADNLGWQGGWQDGRKTSEAFFGKELR